MRDLPFHGGFAQHGGFCIIVTPKSKWLSGRLLCPTEILGMLLSVVSIWAVTAALVLSAIQRLVHGDYDVDGHIMLITSGCAVGVNILWVSGAPGAYISQPVLLKQFGTCPAQDGAGPPSVWRFTRPQSRTPPASASRPLRPRERQRKGGVRPRSGRSGAKCRGAAGSRHHPVLGVWQRNLHVFLRCSERRQLSISRNNNLLLYLWLLSSSQPEYKAADPICTFLFSALVLGTTVPVTKDVFRILMEGKKALLGGLLGRVGETKGSLCAGTPRDVRVHSVRTQLLSVSGVTDVHSLHVWSLNMTHALLSVHVTAGRPTHMQDRGVTLPFDWNPADWKFFVSSEEEADAQTVLTNVTNLLRSEFSFSGVTVQVER